MKSDSVYGNQYNSCKLRLIANQIHRQFSVLEDILLPITHAAPSPFSKSSGTLIPLVDQWISELIHPDVPDKQFPPIPGLAALLSPRSYTLRKTLSVLPGTLGLDPSVSSCEHSLNRFRKEKERRAFSRKQMTISKRADHSAASLLPFVGAEDCSSLPSWQKVNHHQGKNYENILTQQAYDGQ